MLIAIYNLKNTTIESQSYKLSNDGPIYMYIHI